jgi:hypothetical protein
LELEMKKTTLIIAGIIVLVALLAGAAFVGAQLLSGQGLPVQASAGGLKMALGQGGKANQMFSLDIQPAKELPQTQADAKGLFDHRKDNSIFVGTGQVRMMAQKDQSGNVTTSSTHDGPTVEVVVTSQTTVYRDVTLKQFSGQPPSGKIQQVVEPGSLDEIGQDSMITVWGKKTSDRFIADVLVYSLPFVKGSNAGG